jgi:hypothetical protein
LGTSEDRAGTFCRNFCGKSISASAYPNTDKKGNKIFLIYKEIQMGSGAKSCMRNGFLILYMRKCRNISPYIYDDAVSHI